MCDVSALTHVHLRELLDRALQQRQALVDGARGGVEAVVELRQIGLELVAAIAAFLHQRATSVVDVLEAHLVVVHVSLQLL